MPIKITELRKEFRTPAGPIQPVAGLNLAIPDEAFMAIVGKSGSGKSTLLSLLGALARPTSGSIEVDGRDIAQLDDAELTRYRARHVGFVFQAYNLVPNLTALENVMLPMEFGGLPARQRPERARRLLGLVGLEANKHGKRPGKLSGGEQQRVAIARALANKPRIILADEPTGNLDTATGKLILDLLQRLSETERMTVITVTHDMAIATRADRTFEMRDGRFVRVYQVAGGKIVLDRALVPGASLLDLPPLPRGAQTVSAAAPAAAARP